MTNRPAGSPPETVEIDGTSISLSELAHQICVRYRAEFDDELPTDIGLADDWCRHDTQWLLSWAIADLRGLVDFEEQAMWLASVLRHRNFPPERLVRNLMIAAEVVGERVAGDSGAAIASCIERAAQKIATQSFEDSAIPSGSPPASSPTGVDQ